MIALVVTMDIRLKERLVGAMVLVLAAVIFIPMVLDGPDSDRKVSQRVPLPEEPGDERRTQRIDLDAPAATEFVEPASVDLTAAQEESGAEPEPEAEKEEPVVRPASRTAPPETATAAENLPQPDAPWTVQVGSFSQADNAEALAAKLKQLGYPAYVQRHADGGQTYYRVRVGGYPDRESAQRKAGEIGAKIGMTARAAPAS